MNNRELCLAIVADIKQSGIVRNNRLKFAIEEVSTQLNAKFKPYIIHEFALKNGDEIVGVMSSFAEGYSAYNQLYELLEYHKLKAYIGLGFGYMEDIYERDIHKIYGTAITNAYRAVNHFLKMNKSNARQFNNYNKDITTFVYDEDILFPYDSINHFITYINQKNAKRTKKQKEVIAYIENNPHLNYKEISAHFNYSEINIYKIIQRSEYQLVKDAEDSLKSLLVFIQNSLINKS
ncbi:MAG: hypothetical protein WD424_03115 [Paenibacillaceae bacterium]